MILLDWIAGFVTALVASASFVLRLPPQPLTAQTSCATDPANDWAKAALAVRLQVTAAQADDSYHQSAGHQPVAHRLLAYAKHAKHHPLAPLWHPQQHIKPK